VLAVAVRSCGLCGSSELAPAPGHEDSLRRCVACGLVLTAFEPGGDRQLNEDDYFEAAYRGYFERAEQWRHEARRRLDWLLGHSKPDRLLEIGCGGGFFLAEARRAGIDASGVELSPIAARYARERLGVPVTSGAFECTELASGFDAVCAFHMLEHVADPAALVGKVHALLRSGGLFLLEVPNIESAGARRHGSGWPALQPRYHRWHFATEVLTTHMRHAGFEIETCETLFACYYTRLRGFAGPFALASLADTWQATGSMRRTHPSAGDYIRLLARKP
jgi:SAM-dependent methyltransferase